MPALLLPFVSRCLPYLVGGALILGVILYISHVHSELKTAHIEVTEAQKTIFSLRQTNQQNLLVLARLQKQQAEWDGEMLLVQQDDSVQRHIAQQIDTAIATTSPAQNAPAAPVLTATLNTLAHMQGKQ